MTLKLALIGGSGGLGGKLINRLQEDYEVYSTSSKDLDIRNEEKVMDWFGNVQPEIIVFAAGVNHDGLLHKQSFDQINHQIDVNIKGLNHVLKATIPYMREENFGRIILFSSFLGGRPIRGTSVYSACKGYMDTIAKVVAIENARYNITCNTLQLGYMDGGMTYRVPKNILKTAIDNAPNNRMGSIDEIADTVKFLINNSYITGENVGLNGGLGI